jgi:urease accessory protein
VTLVRIAKRAVAGPDAAVSDVGRAEIGFSRDGDGRTYIARQFASYPFHLCRPFYYEGDPPGMATVYAQSCAGGLFEHDRLRLEVKADECAYAHVTTSASTIVHGMDAGYAVQEAGIFAGPGAWIEYLPEPVILFPNARLSSRLQINIAESSGVIASEAYLMHDPDSCGVPFDWLENQVLVEGTCGQIHVRDRYRVTGPSMQYKLPGINGPYFAQGSLLFLYRARANGDLVAAMRSALHAVERTYLGVSALPGKCGALVRILAEDAIGLRSAIYACWVTAREIVVGSGPRPRRK